MQRAIDETDRRRSIQEEFNTDNNITPKSISTKVKDIMEGARVIKGNTKKKREDIEKIVPFKIQDDTIDNLTDTLKKLEDEMFALAKKMEFEKAAVCRDKINSLKRKLIDL
jgi:excinuclease ABC subunit B